MGDVSNLIRAEIERADGILPFDRFMELALYAPEVGFYEREGRVGKRGDFYTSVSVGPLFGEMLARRISSWLTAMDGDWEIVEAGANNGQLANDLLSWFKANRPAQYAGITCRLIEPSATQQRTQEQTLASHAKIVRWHRNWGEVKAIRGVILSNELLDAFPVKVWRWNSQQQGWREMGVSWNGDFRWSGMGDYVSQLDWIHLPEPLLCVLPDGFKVEGHRASVRWWEEAAARLVEGVLLAIDYGLESEEFFSPTRADGTLRAYRDHRTSKGVLMEPGNQDITTHVNFTRIREAGEGAGMETIVDESQSRFLHSILQEMIAGGERGLTAAEIRQYQTLTHPEHLGRPFRVLAQRRKIAR